MNEKPRRQQYRHGAALAKAAFSRQFLGISPLVDAAINLFHPHIVLLMIGTNDVNLSYMLSAAPTTR